jgi:diguanylate cyclase (GGDEF)-like protein
VLLDIDYFKRVNDRYGHSVGDDVLVAFSRCLESQLRQGDLLGRHGGEEFLLFLPMSDIAAALNVAERIRSTAESSPLIDDPVPLTISASVGLAELHRSEAIDAWLERADQALYRATESGQNCMISRLISHRRARRLDRLNSDPIVWSDCKTTS